MHFCFSCVSYFRPLRLAEWADVRPDADSLAQSFSSHHGATGHGSWRRVQRGLQRGNKYTTKEL